MRTIYMSEITMDGTDAHGRYAVATLDGEQAGVSLAGADACLRSLDGLVGGQLLEVGTERVRLASCVAPLAFLDEAPDELALLLGRITVRDHGEAGARAPRRHRRIPGGNDGKAHDFVAG